MPLMRRRNKIKYNKKRKFARTKRMKEDRYLYRIQYRGDVHNPQGHICRLKRKTERERQRAKKR